MKKELHPEDCLIRLCRFCKTPMLKTSYEWDSEYRWYTFYCENCNFHTTIGEPINDIFMESDDGIEHEPLTLEEQGVDEEMNDETKKVHRFTNRFKEENR